MAPLAEGRSVYTLPIVGQPLYFHIVELAARLDGAVPAVMVDDPALLSDQEAMADLGNLVRLLTKKEQQGNEPEAAALILDENSRIELRHPWDLLEASERVLGEMMPGISERAVIEPYVEITGNVRVEAEARILNGARIKGNVYVGPGCTIGNGAMIRGDTSLAAGCIVGFSSEVKNSLLMERCGVGPSAFIADSLVDRDSFFGGTARVSNYRLDECEVEVEVAGRRRSTGRRQFGTIVGENTSFGSGVVILPGRKIGSNCLIGPNVNIVRNVDPGCRVVVQQNLLVTRAESTAPPAVEK
jgi:bifunctional UDP-N-acetylglucosamine pyrophosphorylase/glucosamine-1-phosphate N-acetyltransferase